jgi:hypothetical protein
MSIFLFYNAPKLPAFYPYLAGDIVIVVHIGKSSLSKSLLRRRV